MRVSLLLLPILLATGLSPGAAEARRVPANAQALYAELDQATADYREGLLQMRRGETGPGRDARPAPLRDTRARVLLVVLSQGMTTTAAFPASA